MIQNETNNLRRRIKTKRNVEKPGSDTSENIA